MREHPVQSGIAVLARMKAPGGAIGGQRGWRAVSQRQGGLAFPRLAEPVDLVELDAVPGAGQGGEHPARPVHDLDLRRIPNQNDLRPGPGGRGDQRVQIQGAGHRRLVDDHHRAAVQHRRSWRAGGGSVVGVQPLGQGVGALAGGGGELGGGAGRRCQPDDPVAGVLPGAGGGAQRAGLARPSRRREHGQEVPTSGQAQHRQALARVQPAVATGRHQRGQRDLSVPATAAAGGEVQDPGLGGEDLHGGVAGIRGARCYSDALQADRHRAVQTEREIGELLDPRHDLTGAEPAGRQDGGDLPGDLGAGEHRPASPSRLQRCLCHPRLCHPRLCLLVGLSVAGHRQDPAVHRQDSGLLPSVPRGRLQPHRLAEPVGGPASPGRLGRPARVQRRHLSVLLAGSGLEHRRLHYPGPLRGTEGAAQERFVLGDFWAGLSVNARGAFAPHS